MISDICKKMFPKSLWLFHTNCGACAVGGNIWFDTYNVLGGVDKVIPVNMYIPGCPPRPEAIVYGAALALGLVPKKVAAQKEQHLPEGFDLDAYLKQWKAI